MKNYRDHITTALRFPWKPHGCCSRTLGLRDTRQPTQGADSFVRLDSVAIQPVVAYQSRALEWDQTLCGQRLRI